MLTILSTIFPFFKESFGLPIIFIIFTFFALLNALFGLIFVPETKGKSNEEIVDMLGE